MRKTYGRYHSTALPTIPEGIFLFSVSVDVASIDTSCSEDHRLWLFVSFCIFSIINYTMMLISALLWVKNSPFFGYISVQLTFSDTIDTVWF
jgi:hypothetical protein